MEFISLMKVKLEGIEGVSDWPVGPGGPCPGWPGPCETPGGPGEKSISPWPESLPWAGPETGDPMGPLEFAPEFPI